ncbi:MAG: response regulator [Chthoniobacteraceae bacterium]
MSGRPVRIYIVEDSRLLVGALRLHIKENRGLELIGQAATEKQATEEIRSLRPDLVLLDIHLAQGDGFEVLAQLNQSEAPPVVAMMTFEPSTALRSRAGDSGAHLFFDKASEAGALLDLLNNLGSGKVTLASLSKPKTNQ